MNRSVTVFSLALVIIVLAVYTGLWVYGARQLQDLVERWAAGLRADGWTVEIASQGTVGFPAAARIVMPAVSLTAPPEQGGWTWAADDVVLEVTPWRLMRPELRVNGEQTLATPAGERWDATSEVFAGVVHLGTSGRAESLDLMTTNLTAVRQPDGARIALSEGTATVTDARGNGEADYETTTYALRLDLEGLTLPMSPEGPFSPTIRRASFETRVLGPFPVNEPNPESLAEWRDAGGVIEVDRFSVDWQPIRVSGVGTLALDDNLQPVAAFSARLSNLFATIDALERSNTIRKADATMARVVLGLASSRGGNGEGSVEVPISIQDRRLSVGPLTLLELPSIRW